MRVGYPCRQSLSGWFYRLNATIVSLLALALSLAGCGETTRKMFQRYAPQFDEKRQEFKRIAAMLPPPGSVKENSQATASPKPVLNEKNSDSNNAEVVMVDQLLDPDIKTDDAGRLDVLLSGNLLLGIRWTGPKSPLESSALDRKNPSLENTLKQGLGERYLIVLRPVKYVPPVAADEATYKRGMADLEGFVVDLSGPRILSSFRYVAQSADRVEYSTRKGDSATARQAQLEKFAQSSLYTDARKKLKPLLEQSTEGNFTFE